MNAEELDGHCFFDAYTGGCWYTGGYPGGNEWKGVQRAREKGDCIGMLVDLDQGSMLSGRTA